MIGLNVLKMIWSWHCAYSMVTGQLSHLKVPKLNVGMIYGFCLDKLINNWNNLTSQCLNVCIFLETLESWHFNAILSAIHRMAYSDTDQILQGMFWVAIFNFSKISFQMKMYVS